MSNKKLALIIIACGIVLFTGMFVFFGNGVDGQVIDSVSGKPIPGAVISIGNVSLYADENGEFSRWIAPFSTSAIMANHPCYDSFVIYTQGFDLSKKLTISLSPSTYETMLATCREQLNKSTNYSAKTKVISYEYPMDDSEPIAHQNETVYVTTPDTRLYGQLYSNSKEGVLPGGMTTIIKDSDPNKPTSIVYKRDGTIPRIYFHYNDEWITFKANQDLDFAIPVTEKDSRAILDPLLAYGKPNVFTFLQDNTQKAMDGSKLVGCTTTWDKESPLRGKSITFLFRENGLWYDVEFSDTGENPASKPAKYNFSMLHYGDNVDIEIPKEATERTLGQN